MEKINISIIIPVYNVEEYLHDCLDSISQLKAFSWEAILIDDGSSDNSGAICDEYVDNYQNFKVIHQENKGVSVARNVGLDSTRGEWVWFVDSDDMINPNFIIDNIREMDSADYVLFDFCTFKENKTPEKTGALTHCSLCTESFDKNNFLLHNRCNHHQRIFYKRSLLGYENSDKILRFSPGIRVGEDLEFQYKYLTRCKRPVLLNAVLYNYRLREGSATQDENYRRKNVEDLPLVIENLLQWCKQEEAKPEPWLEIRIQQMFQNLLYSATLVNGVDKNVLQNTIRRLLKECRNEGFLFPNSVKMRIAYLSISFYSLLNKAYLKLKGIK